MRWVEAGGDLGNAVGRGGKKILPPGSEHLGVKKTRWPRMTEMMLHGKKKFRRGLAIN